MNQPTDTLDNDPPVVAAVLAFAGVYIICLVLAFAIAPYLMTALYALGLAAVVLLFVIGGRGAADG